MNRINRSPASWVPALMIASQLLLTGFVGYWLASQYRNERILLHEQLVQKYMEAHSQVIDSLIFNQVVHPAIKITGREEKVQGTFVAIGIKDDSLHQRKGREGQIMISALEKEDVILRSVKMIIRSDSVSLARGRTDGRLYPGMPDTGLFKNIYQEKVEDEGLSFHITWMDGSDSVGLKHKASAIQVTPAHAGELPTASIAGFSPYLVRLLFPQILFALVLLILTGSAFILAWKSLKRQVMLNALRNEFVSNISHELKTPVATVKVAIESIRDYGGTMDPGRSREYLEMASLELSRLDRLVGRVLDQSLLEEHHGLPRLEKIDLNVLFVKVVSTFQQQIEEVGARVEFNQGEMDGCMVTGDLVYLQGVLVNLLDNSLKYGGSGVRVTIRTWREGRRVFAEVCDNGPGIPREYHGRVFEKFFRIPGHHKHNVKGYGLGLSFAAQVMKQHGGSIRLESPREGGCRFILTFPEAGL